MYWLTFLALSLALYLPPLDLARHVWQWAAWRSWRVLLLGWGVPAWLAYVLWLGFIYAALGTSLYLAQRRLPEDSDLVRFGRRLSRAGLGGLEVLMAAVALDILLLAWPLLPAAQAVYGWRGAISPPVAALAGLFLLAEALRLAENHALADRAFSARRLSWLVEHGHDRWRPP